MNFSFAIWLLTGLFGGDDPTAAEDARRFEAEVRPLLVEHCFKCHGPERKRVKGGLRLAGRDALLVGGDSGPSVVPGAPEQSRLIHAVRWEDEDLRMPPKTRLEDAEIETLVDWVRRGAPWPTYEQVAEEDDDEPGPPTIEDGRDWWSFRPVRPPAVPIVADANAAAHPIDAFVQARLDAAGITPAPRATPRELVRRLSFDLTGLAPTRAEIEAFEREPSDAAWGRLVDGYLARDAYGERWGRHWLDVVRFAQTNGYERDAEKPFAWRYRDYVVRAFNEDKPFDRFVLEQLAGDELDDDSSALSDARVATGFYRVGVWDDEPDDEAQAVFDELDDILRVTTEGFLGLSVGCARCHDHKFDPIRQEDYYGFLAFVRGVRPYEKPFYRLDSPTLQPLDEWTAIRDWRTRRQQEIDTASAALDRLVGAEKDAIAAALPTLSEEVQQAYRTPPAKRTDDQSLLLNRALAPFRSGTPEEQDRAYELRVQLAAARLQNVGDLTWALVVKEDGATPPPTHLMVRGDPHSPAAEVAPHFPPVVCADDAAAVPPPPTPDPKGRSSGRRRALADWITSPDNPLTARVLVNRLWHHHFGRGIVATPNDFGRTGVPPTHPALLDWLAHELVRTGWSLKRMHRLILSSETWRRSSRATDPVGRAEDEANHLLWRQNVRRLDAEAVRDAYLATAGVLNRTPGGRGFFPELAPAAMSGASRPGEGWEFSTEEERARRSVYAYAKRNLRVPLLEAFDAASVNLPIGARPVTTVATQALMQLNGTFAHRAARRFADRIAAEAGEDPEARVTAAWSIALGRPPTDDERAIARDLLASETERLYGTSDPVSFGPRTGRVLEKTFLAAARGDDLMFGPAEGFSYQKGAWGNEYNDTRQVDPDRGPAALSQRGLVGDGGVAFTFAPGASTTSVGLLLRGAADGDLVRGIELRLALDRAEIDVVVHGEDEAPETLASHAITWPDQITLGVALSGPTISVSYGGAALFSHTDPRLDVGDGAVGIRVGGGAIAVSRLVVDDGTGDPTVLVHPRPIDPARRALESLALVVLNLNEFVTVD